MANKILLIAWSLLLNQNTNYLLYDLPTLSAELLAAAAWAFTRDQRCVHFDSRLDLLPPFLKTGLIYLSIFFSSSVSALKGSDPAASNSSLNVQHEQMGILILCVVLVWGVDRMDMLYNNFTREAFLAFDKWLILLFAVYELALMN